MPDPAAENAPGNAPKDQNWLKSSLLFSLFVLTATLDPLLGNRAQGIHTFAEADALKATTVLRRQMPDSDLDPSIQGSLRDVF